MHATRAVCLVLGRSRSPADSFCDAGCPATPTTPAAIVPKLTREVDIPATQVWTDTTVDLAVGERIVVESSGQVKYQTQLAGPQGVERTWTDLTRSLPVNGARAGSLVGRIGDGDSTIPFAIGGHKEVWRGGRDACFWESMSRLPNSARGNFHAKVQVFDASPAAVVSAIKITQEFLQQIPRRIGDEKGDPGDMVNFMIIGPQEALKKTYEDGRMDAGRQEQEAGHLSRSHSNFGQDAYLAMPMSQLYLFGRVQDFGYEHAEPVQMVHSGTI